MQHGTKFGSLPPWIYGLTQVHETQILTLTGNHEFIASHLIVSRLVYPSSLLEHRFSAIIRVVHACSKFDMEFPVWPW